MLFGINEFDRMTIELIPAICLARHPTEGPDLLEMGQNI